MPRRGRNGGGRGGGHHANRNNVRRHHGGGAHDGQMIVISDLDLQQWTESWKSGLFSCFEDPAACCDGIFCEPCQVGFVRNELDYRGAVPPQWAGVPCCKHCLTNIMGTFFAWPWMGSAISACNLRTAVRHRYQINSGETTCASCCIGCWCPCCSNCQVVRELDARGENPGGCFKTETRFPDVPRPVPMDSSDSEQQQQQHQQQQQNQIPQAGEQPMMAQPPMMWQQQPQHQQQQPGMFGDPQQQGHNSQFAPPPPPQYGSGAQPGLY